MYRKDNRTLNTTSSNVLVDTLYTYVTDLDISFEGKLKCDIAFELITVLCIFRNLSVGRFLEQIFTILCSFRCLYYISETVKCSRLNYQHKF
jgi:hypothetical protein